MYSDAAAFVRPREAKRSIVTSLRMLAGVYRRKPEARLAVSLGLVTRIPY
jgi:hypothetical protein